MELYDTHPDKRSRGIVSQAGLILLLGAVVAIVGAAIWWVVCPGAATLWRIWVAPVIESVRHAIGV